MCLSRLCVHLQLTHESRVICSVQTKLVPEEASSITVYWAESVKEKCWNAAILSTPKEWNIGYTSFSTAVCNSKLTIRYIQGKSQTPKASSTAHISIKVLRARYR